jgi:hypothetical protein
MQGLHVAPIRLPVMHDGHLVAVVCLPRERLGCRPQPPVRIGIGDAPHGRLSGQSGYRLQAEVVGWLGPGPEYGNESRRGWGVGGEGSIGNDERDLEPVVD